MSIPRTTNQPQRSERLKRAGLLSTAHNRDVYRALTDALVAMFSMDDWVRLADELGDAGDVIESHPRLRRALHWNDDDYPTAARNVVENILGDDLNHLEVLVQAANLSAWLPSHDAQRSERLLPPSSEIVSMLLENEELTTGGVRQQIRRLQELSTTEHPSEVIGKAKNTVEAVCKLVLFRRPPPEAVGDALPAQVATAFAALGIDPKDPPGPDATAPPLRQMLQGTKSAASALAELRNEAGDGHGSVEAIPVSELTEVAELARSIAVAVATVLLHTLDRRLKA